MKNNKTQEQIDKLKARIPIIEQEIQAATYQAQVLFKHGKDAADQVNDFFLPQLQSTQTQIESIVVENLVCGGGWDLKEWQSWQPQAALLEETIRIGEYRESLEDRSSNFAMPHFAPLIGRKASLIIVSDDRTVDKAIGLLQSLAVRIALLLPHTARYTLVDPVGGGAAFPMQRYLPHVRESSDDIRRDLDGVSRDIQQIIATYLDAIANSFELLPDDIRSNERLEFILAANFPKRYDRRAIEALQSIANTGPKAGKYLILHYNKSIDLPRDLSMNDFDNAVYIDLTQGCGKAPQDPARQLKFIPDPAPSPSLQAELFTKLSQAKPPQRNLDWHKLIGIPESDWWQETAAKIIETPIGGVGSNQLLKVWFGENPEKRVCAHGMLGAMTGAGKSTLYHVAILGLTTRYSPAELKLYLIDGKQGVEFQAYRHLPHAEVVSLHSPPELSRSVLQELIIEMERRYGMFSEPDVRVQDLAGYYRKEQPSGKLPRILLLVDEFQELFEGDTDGLASGYLLKLSQQGRAAGIHMLLASQRLGAVGMLNRDAIFGNFHLLMAMQMRHDDIQSLTGFGRRGKQLIQTCDLPGKIVVNDALGDDNNNQLGKVAMLSGSDRDVLIEALKTRASNRFALIDLPLQIIFDGNTQPNLIENPQLQYLLQQRNWLTPAAWQAHARNDIHHGGLNISDWFTAERPRVMWLGQEFSVRGQARIILRRRLAENAIALGAENTARYGMLAAMLNSLAVNTNPQASQFVIIDRSMPESDWYEALASVANTILKPLGYTCLFTRASQAVTPQIDRLIAELDRRSQLDEDLQIAEPSIFLILTELDRVDEARRQTDAYGSNDSQLGEKLRRIYIEGSRLGIHAIVSFASFRAMTNTLDERRDLPNFRHRIALQMSEDESFNFVRNRAAARLQIDGNKPIVALYLDMENDRQVRFKPYSTTATIPYQEQLAIIAKQLTTWQKS